MSYRRLWSRAVGAFYRYRRYRGGRFWTFVSNAGTLLRYIVFTLTKKAIGPSEIILDPANVCNLRCPLCPTGARKLDFDKRFMEIGTFTSIVDRLVRDFPLLCTVHLFSWGEPFLHPDIFRIVRYLKKKGFFILMDSNFSYARDKGFFVSLVESGLDVLTVSLDGASQESYSAYRQGGDFEMVLANLRLAVETRERLGKKSPDIVWKYIVHRYNEDRVDAAISMARELGIRLDIVPIGLGDVLPDMEFEEPLESRKTRWLPVRDKFVNPAYIPGNAGPAQGSRIRFCPFPFKTLVVTPDGKVAPCPVVTSEKNIFGDATKGQVKRIWNNEYFMHARRIFTGKRILKTGARTICDRCANAKTIVASRMNAREGK